MSETPPSKKIWDRTAWRDAGFFLAYLRPHFNVFIPAMVALALTSLLTITFMSRFGKRPMHLFGLLGTLLFLIGFGIAVYLAYAKFFMSAFRMTERPLFYFGLLAMVLGTQLFIAGFLGEMISRSSADRNRYLIEKELL